MTPARSTPLDDVLYQLAIEEIPFPRSKTINDFVRYYPEYKREIVEFAADLAAEAMRGERDSGIEPCTLSTSHAVSKAMSAFQNHLDAELALEAIREELLALTRDCDDERAP